MGMTLHWHSSQGFVRTATRTAHQHILMSDVEIRAKKKDVQIRAHAVQGSSVLYLEHGGKKSKTRRLYGLLLAQQFVGYFWPV